MTDVKMLADLLAATHFYWNYDYSSIGELSEMAKANVAEYERLEMEDPERLEKIEDSFRLLLARTLQPRAINQFGSASDDATRHLLLEEIRSSGNAARLRQVAEEALKDTMPNPHFSALIDDCIKQQEELAADTFTEMVGRVRLIPEADGTAVTDVLSEMWEEACHANRK